MTARHFPRPLGRLGLALGAVSLVAVSACTDPATGDRSNARTGALIGRKSDMAVPPAVRPRSFLECRGVIR